MSAPALSLAVSCAQNLNTVNGCRSCPVSSSHDSFVYPKAAAPACSLAQTGKGKRERVCKCHQANHPLLVESVSDRSVSQYWKRFMRSIGIGDACYWSNTAVTSYLLYNLLGVSLYMYVRYAYGDLEVEPLRSDLQVVHHRRRHEVARVGVRTGGLRCLRPKDIG